MRVQDIPDIFSSPDPDVLEWAAQEGRILLTHDVQTMVGYAYERVKAGLPMPGVIEVKKNPAIGKIIEELHVFIECAEPEDFENQVLFLSV